MARRGDREDDEDRRRGGDFVYRGRERTAEGMVRHGKAKGVYDSIFVDGLNLFKPKEGENCIRILPPGWIEDPEMVERWEDSWDIAILQHFNVGADDGRYLCLAMKDEPCPICEARRDMDKEEADDLRAGNGRVVWLIDRNDERAGPQIWAMPQTKVYNEIISRSVKAKPVIQVDDPEEGYDIYFEKEGTKDRTTYSSIDIARDATPLCDDEARQKKWLRYITDHPLPGCLNFYEPDYLESVLRGQKSRRDDEEEDTRRSPREARRRDDDDGGSSARRRPEKLVGDDGNGEDRSSSRSHRSARDADEDGDDGTIRPRGTRRRDDDGEDEARPTERSARRGNDDDDPGEGEELAGRASRARRDDEPEGSRSARKGMGRLQEKRAGK